MSATKSLWPAGIGIVDADLQRMADNAAGMDDRVLELIAATEAAGGQINKRVIPLTDESKPVPASSLLFKSPRMLVSDASMWGGVVGRARCGPALFIISSVITLPDVPRNLISAVILISLESAAFGSSAGGRTDVLYAVATYTPPAAAAQSRRMKDTTTGATSTQVASVYTEPVVTLSIVAGTEGAPAVIPAVPADGAASWNIKLAEVRLPAGYVSGAALFDVPNGHYTRQRWERGGVTVQAQRTVRGAGMAFVAGSNAGQDPTPQTSSRQAGTGIVRGVFRHTGAGADITLDDSLDWRMREVRLSLYRPAVHAVVAPYGQFPPPSIVTVPGTSIRETTGGFVHTGILSALGPFWSSTGPPVIQFFADNATGKLRATIAGAPTDIAVGDHYTFFAEYLDQATEVVV